MRWPRTIAHCVLAHLKIFAVSRAPACYPSPIINHSADGPSSSARCFSRPRARIHPVTPERQRRGLVPVSTRIFILTNGRTKRRATKTKRKSVGKVKRRKRVRSMRDLLTLRCPLFLLFLRPPAPLSHPCREWKRFGREFCF